MSIRQLIWTGGLALALPVAAQTRPPAAPIVPTVPPVTAAPGAVSAAATPAARVLTLTQALAAARDNLDVAISQGNLAAARADILAADHAPLPVLSGIVENIDLKNGVGAGNALRDKRLDKTVGLDWLYERGDKRRLRTAAAERRGAA